MPVTVPTPWSIVRDVAPLTVHESVEDSPLWIVVGLALKLEIVGGFLTLGVVLPPPHPKLASITASTRDSVNNLFISPDSFFCES